MLNLSVPNEFLQRWLLPRLGEFTRQHPEIEVRFGPSRVTLDFGRDDFHAAILYGPGQWPGLKAERLLDWRPAFDFRQGVAALVEWYNENREWAREIRTQ